ncbi:MAG: bifunctional nuclease family protein [Acidobacteriota bacterium]
MIYSRAWITFLACVCVLIMIPAAGAAGQAKPLDEFVRVEIWRILLDKDEHHVLVLLRDAGDEDNGKVMPIQIGMEEGLSLMTAFYKRSSPRPLSHDLMQRLLGELDAKLVRLKINKMERGIFFAELGLQQGTREFALDCRPSDGMALALRVGVPMLVRRQLLNEQAVGIDELPERGESKLLGEY